MKALWKIILLNLHHLEPKVQDAFALLLRFHLETRCDAAISQGVIGKVRIKAVLQDLRMLCLERFLSMKLQSCFSKESSATPLRAFMVSVFLRICLEIAESLGETAAQKLILNLKNPAPVCFTKKFIMNNNS